MELFAINLCQGNSFHSTNNHAVSQFFLKIRPSFFRPALQLTIFSFLRPPTFRLAFFVVLFNALVLRRQILSLFLSLSRSCALKSFVLFVRFFHSFVCRLISFSYYETGAPLLLNLAKKSNFLCISQTAGRKHF